MPETVRDIILEGLGRKLGEAVELRSRPISRQEAIKLAHDSLIRAERERLEAADKEAGAMADDRTKARRFVLLRKKDLSGNSGTGYVAEGVMFSDGTCAMRWKTETASTTIYDDIEHVKKLHGHEGATELEWVDD